MIVPSKRFDRSLPHHPSPHAHAEPQELKRLDVLMRDIIDIDVEIRAHEQTLKDLHQQVVAEENIVSPLSMLHTTFEMLKFQILQSDVLELYEAQTQETLDNYNKKTTRQKYAKSEAYATFKQSIYVSPESSDLTLRSLILFLRRYSIQTKRCHL
jgi:hypothetical protein